MDQRPEPSLRGLLLGGLIGLVSGLLLGYLALFDQSFLHLPWPGATLGQMTIQSWFVPLLVATTLLGAVYYHAEA